MQSDRSSAGSRRLSRAWIGALLAAAGLGLVAAPAGAQPTTIPRFTLELSNPGARSLGLGGAFAALADDATAAFANPAGLTQLTRPEVSLETRLWDRSPQYLAGGRTDGEPTGRGIDHGGPAGGLTTDRAADRVFGPSYGAVVLPRGRWTLAVFGHQLARFEIRSESQGFFSTSEDGGPSLFSPTGAEGTLRYPGSRERVDARVTTGGVAAAYRWTDRISVGLSLAAQQSDLETSSALYLPDDDSVEALFAPITFQETRLFLSNTIDVSDTALAVTAGLRARLTDRLSGGLFYRGGTEAEGQAQFFTGPAFYVQIDVPAQKAIFRIPEVWGGGLAYRSRGGALTLALEVDRVGYAGLVQVFDFDGEPIDGGRTYQDAWEYHLGGEWALLRRDPILAFRAGYWVEDNGDDLIEESFHHFAVGFGLAASSFQMDLAVDFSEEEDTASLSFIYAF